MQITFSELKTLKTCARKHRLQYDLRIRPVKTDENFRFGSLVHEFHDYRSRYDVQQTISLMYDFVDDPIEWNYLSAVIAAHEWRWAEMNEKMGIVASEVEFEVPIVNPESGKSSRTFTLAGKIDKIVRMPSGNLAILEYKTTSRDLSADSEYWQHLRMDSQISLYFLAAQQKGWNVTSILYDVIKKPKLQPRELTQAETKLLSETGDYLTRLNQGEEPELIGNFLWNGIDGDITINQTPVEIVEGKKGYSIVESPEMYGQRLMKYLAKNHEQFLARREIARSVRDVEEIQRELWIQTKVLLERRRGVYWEKNDSACITFSTCPYFALCANGFDPEDPHFTLDDRFMIIEESHPELKGNQQDAPETNTQASTTTTEPTTIDTTREFTKTNDEPDNHADTIPGNAADSGNANAGE